MAGDRKDAHTKHPRRDELTDMQGRLMGKRVQGQAFLNGAIDHGAHFCTYLLGTDMEMNTPDGFALMNWETGYGDWIADPAWDTLRPVPWLEKSAIVLSDTVDHHGAEIPVSPRTMLKRQVEKAAALGFSVMAGSEFEYYLLTDTYEAANRKGYIGLERFGYYNEDYHLLQATKGEPIHGKLRNLMTEARIPVEFSKGEAAPGQHEVNIHYSDVLEMSDRSVLFKHGAKEIAWLNGYGLTFMAKPDHTWTGSSGHLHMSTWSADGEKPLTNDDDAGLPYGMSRQFSQFVAGMMTLSRELAVFIAPFINSYKRYASLSWAPVNVVWSPTDAVVVSVKTLTTTEPATPASPPTEAPIAMPWMFSSCDAETDDDVLPAVSVSWSAIVAVTGLLTTKMAADTPTPADEPMPTPPVMSL